jgi:hypothetical protein
MNPYVQDFVLRGRGKNRGRFEQTRRPRLREFRSKITFHSKIGGHVLTLYFGTYQSGEWQLMENRQMLGWKEERTILGL